MVQKVSRPQRCGPIGVVEGGAGASLRFELATDSALGTPRETLDAIIRLDFRGVEAPRDQALHAVDSVLRVRQGLTFCNLSDESLALIGEMQS